MSLGDIVATLLTIIALILAITHSRELRSQTEKAKKLTESIEEITADIEQIRLAASTRHLNAFPKFLDDIVELIQGSSEVVEICCDFPAYGCFSNPDSFLSYKQALESKAQNIEVELTCLSLAPRQALTIEQFPPVGTRWTSWKQESTAKLRRFLVNHKIRVEPEELRKEDFLAALEEENKKVLVILRDETIHGIDTLLPIYFWISDKNKAIFSIPRSAREMRDITEHGFFTMDPNLIQGLRDIKARYHAMVSQ
ncbi:MAG TPA: hypothetical protein VGS22_19755 [Thermoanaerobaculia bacterium]|nr:hypothetical protein [Thermoanaerobaculia bacterium]